MALDRRDVLAAVVALVGGAAVVAAPRQLVVIAVGVACVMLISRPLGRLAVVALGTVGALGGTNVGAMKILYLAVAAAATLVSAYSLMRRRDAAHRSLWLASLVLETATVGSFFIAQSHGVSPSDWLRDALPYMFLGVAPLVGADAGTEPPRGILAIFVAAGTVTTLVFSLTWSSRHGASSIATGVGLDSLVLVAAFFCMLFVQAAMRSRGRVWWAIGAVAVATAVTVTGTRSAVVLVGVLVATAGSRRKGLLPLHRGLFVLVAAAVAVAVSAPLIAAQMSHHGDYLSGRFDLLGRVLQGHSDQSLSLRAAQYSLAEAQFRAHPLLGTGPGYVYDLSPLGQGPSFSLDTPVAVFSKLGLLGAAALATFIVLVARFTRGLRRTIGTAAVRGAAGVVLLLIPLGNPFEDKGLPVALMLLLAYAVSLAKDEEATPVHVDETASHVPAASAA